MDQPESADPDRRGGEAPLIRRALRLARLPVLIALVITPVRFLLELAGVPTAYVFPLGLLWLALGFSIYWGFKLSPEARPYRLLWLSLALFSPPSRVPVFLLWWIDTAWGIGTHYNIFESWDQALVGQLFYGSLLQIIPGGILGSLTLGIQRSRAVSN
jgi:hypothetical protein